jgi:hypothetical protein
MRKFLLVLAVTCLVLVGWCFHRRLFQDDEKRIREVIEEMRVAAQEKSADRVIEHFGNEYSDKDGNTKIMIYGLLKNNLNRVDELRVKVDDVSVMVTGDRAFCTLNIVAEAVKDGKVYYPFGSDSDPENPTLTFKKTKTGDWVIIKVENVRESNF